MEVWYIDPHASDASTQRFVNEVSRVIASVGKKNISNNRLYSFVQ